MQTCSEDSISKRDLRDAIIDGLGQLPEKIRQVGGAVTKSRFSVNCFGSCIFSMKVCARIRRAGAGAGATIALMPSTARRLASCAGLISSLCCSAGPPGFPPPCCAFCAMPASCCLLTCPIVLCPAQHMHTTFAPPPHTHTKGAAPGQGDAPAGGAAAGGAVAAGVWAGLQLRHCAGGCAQGKRRPAAASLQQPPLLCLRPAFPRLLARSLRLLARPTTQLVGAAGLLLRHVAAAGLSRTATSAPCP
jgi:hypothetical protein